MEVGRIVLTLRSALIRRIQCASLANRVGFVVVAVPAIHARVITSATNLGRPKVPALRWRAQAQAQVQVHTQMMTTNQALTITNRTQETKMQISSSRMTRSTLAVKRLGQG